MAHVNKALLGVGGEVGAGPVDVNNITSWMETWKQGYDRNAWHAIRGDPRAADTACRKRATYKAYFKNEHDDRKKYLAKYLSAGMSLHHKVIRSMAQFRLGCHSLRVERGRYTGLSFAERTCLRCNNGVVDNEHHMLFDCSAFSDLRQDNRFSHLFGAHNVRDFASHSDWQNAAKFVHLCLRTTADRDVG
jgi:hypothetical protein